MCFGELRLRRQVELTIGIGFARTLNGEDSAPRAVVVLLVAAGFRCPYLCQGSRPRRGRLNQPGHGQAAVGDEHFLALSDAGQEPRQHGLSF